MAELEDLVTVAEAARLLCCAKPTVHGYLRRGLLKAEARKGNMLLIAASAIRDFRPPLPGNPTLRHQK